MKECKYKWSLELARKKANLTQEEMASMLNLSRTMYRRYEKGELTFRMDKAWQFSKIVGLPVDDIIFFEINYTSSVPNCNIDQLVNQT